MQICLENTFHLRILGLASYREPRHDRQIFFPDLTGRTAAPMAGPATIFFRYFARIPKLPAVGKASCLVEVDADQLRIRLKVQQHSPSRQFCHR